MLNSGDPDLTVPIDQGLTVCLCLSVQILRVSTLRYLESRCSDISVHLMDLEFCGLVFHLQLLPIALNSMIL